MPDDVIRDLYFYCDLRPADLDALRSPSFSHPRVRETLIRDGLLEKVSPAGGWRLTARGRDLLNRAETIEAGTFRPRGKSKPLSSSVRTTTPPQLDQADRFVLDFLTNNPAVSFRALLDQYRFPLVSLQHLDQMGFASGDYVRGAPWCATPRGKEFLALQS